MTTVTPWFKEADKVKCVFAPRAASEGKWKAQGIKNTPWANVGVGTDGKVGKDFAAALASIPASTITDAALNEKLRDDLGKLDTLHDFWAAASSEGGTGRGAINIQYILDSITWGDTPDDFFYPQGAAAWMKAHVADASVRSNLEEMGEAYFEQAIRADDATSLIPSLCNTKREPGNTQGYTISALMKEYADMQLEASPPQNGPMMQFLIDRPNIQAIDLACPKSSKTGPSPKKAMFGGKEVLSGNKLSQMNYVARFITKFFNYPDSGTPAGVGFVIDATSDPLNCIFQGQTWAHNQAGGGVRTIGTALTSADSATGGAGDKGTRSIDAASCRCQVGFLGAKKATGTPISCPFDKRYDPFPFPFTTADPDEGDIFLITSNIFTQKRASWLEAKRNQGAAVQAFMVKRVYYKGKPGASFSKQNQSGIILVAELEDRTTNTIRKAVADFSISATATAGVSGASVATLKGVIKTIWDTAQAGGNIGAALDAFKQTGAWKGELDLTPILKEMLTLNMSYMDLVLFLLDYKRSGDWEQVHTMGYLDANAPINPLGVHPIFCTGDRLCALYARYKQRNCIYSHHNTLSLYRPTRVDMTPAEQAAAEAIARKATLTNSLIAFWTDVLIPMDLLSGAARAGWDDDAITTPSSIPTAQKWNRFLDLYAGLDAAAGGPPTSLLNQLIQKLCGGCDPKTLDPSSPSLYWFLILDLIALRTRFRSYRDNFTLQRGQITTMFSGDPDYTQLGSLMATSATIKAQELATKPKAITTITDPPPNLAAWTDVLKPWPDEKVVEFQSTIDEFNAGTSELGDFPTYLRGMMAAAFGEASAKKPLGVISIDQLGIDLGEAAPPGKDRKAFLAGTGLAADRSTIVASMRGSIFLSTDANVSGAYNDVANAITAIEMYDSIRQSELEKTKATSLMRKWQGKFEKGQVADFIRGANLAKLNDGAKAILGNVTRQLTSVGVAAIKSLVAPADPPGTGTQTIESILDITGTLEVPDRDGMPPIEYTGEGDAKTVFSPKEVLSPLQRLAVEVAKADGFQAVTPAVTEVDMEGGGGGQEGGVVTRSDERGGRVTSRECTEALKKYDWDILFQGTREASRVTMPVLESFISRQYRGYYVTFATHRLVDLGNQYFSNSIDVHADRASKRVQVVMSETPRVRDEVRVLYPVKRELLTQAIALASGSVSLVGLPEFVGQLGVVGNSLLPDEAVSQLGIAVSTLSLLASATQLDNAIRTLVWCLTPGSSSAIVPLGLDMIRKAGGATLGAINEEAAEIAGGAFAAAVLAAAEQSLMVALGTGDPEAIASAEGELKAASSKAAQAAAQAAQQQSGSPLTYTPAAVAQNLENVRDALYSTGLAASDAIAGFILQMADDAERHFQLLSPQLAAQPISDAPLLNALKVGSTQGVQEWIRVVGTRDSAAGNMASMASQLEGELVKARSAALEAQRAGESEEARTSREKDTLTAIVGATDSLVQAIEGTTWGKQQMQAFTRLYVGVRGGADTQLFLNRRAATIRAVELIQASVEARLSYLAKLDKMNNELASAVTIRDWKHLISTRLPDLLSEPVGAAQMRRAVIVGMGVRDDDTIFLGSELVEGREELLRFADMDIRSAQMYALQDYGTVFGGGWLAQVWANLYEEVERGIPTLPQKTQSFSAAGTWGAGTWGAVARAAWDPTLTLHLPGLTMAIPGLAETGAGEPGITVGKCFVQLFRVYAGGCDPAAGDIERCWTSSATEIGATYSTLAETFNQYFAAFLASSPPEIQEDGILAVMQCIPDPLKILQLLTNLEWSPDDPMSPYGRGSVKITHYEFAVALAREQGFATIDKDGNDLISFEEWKAAKLPPSEFKEAIDRAGEVEAERGEDRRVRRKVGEGGGKGGAKRDRGQDDESSSSSPSPELTQAEKDDRVAAMMALQGPPQSLSEERMEEEEAGVAEEQLTMAGWALWIESQAGRAFTQTACELVGASCTAPRSNSSVVLKFVNEAIRGITSYDDWVWWQILVIRFFAFLDRYIGEFLYEEDDEANVVSYISLGAEVEGLMRGQKAQLGYSSTLQAERESVEVLEHLRTVGKDAAANRAATLEPSKEWEIAAMLAGTLMSEFAEALEEGKGDERVGVLKDEMVNLEVQESDMQSQLLAVGRLMVEAGAAITREIRSRPEAEYPAGLIQTIETDRGGLQQRFGQTLAGMFGLQDAQQLDALTMALAIPYTLDKMREAKNDGTRLFLEQFLSWFAFPYIFSAQANNALSANPDTLTDKAVEQDYETGAGSWSIWDIDCGVGPDVIALWITATMSPAAAATKLAEMSQKSRSAVMQRMSPQTVDQIRASASPENAVLMGVGGGKRRTRRKRPRARKTRRKGQKTKNKKTRIRKRRGKKPTRERNARRRAKTNKRFVFRK